MIELLNQNLGVFVAKLTLTVSSKSLRCGRSMSHYLDSDRRDYLDFFNLSSHALTDNDLLSQHCQKVTPLSQTATGVIAWMRLTMHLDLFDHLFDQNIARIANAVQCHN